MIDKPMVRTRSGFPAVGLVAVVAVVAMVMGGLSGLGADWMLSAFRAPDTVPSPDAPGATGPDATGPDATGPDATGPEAPQPEAGEPSAALPEFDAAFPTGSMQYLSGVTVSQLTQVRSEGITGWVCRADTVAGRSPSGAAESIGCYADGRIGPQVGIRAEYDDDTRIRKVTARCSLGVGSPVCRSLYAEVGAVVLSGQPDLQQQASDWISEHVDTDESATFGKVRVQVSLEPASITFTPTA